MFQTDLMYDTRTVCMNIDDQCDYTATFSLTGNNGKYTNPEWKKDEPR